MIPTAMPTITGSVVVVELEKSVSSSLTDDEIANIVTEAELIFGVFPGNVVPTISYETEGSITVQGDINDDILDSIRESIAEVLDIHPSEVTLSVDPVTGEVEYTLTSPLAEEASALQKMMQSDATSDAIGALVAEENPEIKTVTAMTSFKYFRHKSIFALQFYMTNNILLLRLQLFQNMVLLRTWILLLTLQIPTMLMHLYQHSSLRCQKTS